MRPAAVRSSRFHLRVTDGRRLGLVAATLLLTGHGYPATGNTLPPAKSTVGKNGATTMPMRFLLAGVEIVG